MKQNGIWVAYEWAQVPQWFTGYTLSKGVTGPVIAERDGKKYIISKSKEAASQYVLLPVIMQEEKCTHVDTEHPVPLSNG